MRVESERIAILRRAILRVAGLVPWHSKCLDQALCAQGVLARRKISTTLYFGMIKDDTGKWLAHAWVRSGDQWVIGYQADKQYTVVGSYARIV